MKNTKTKEKENSEKIYQILDNGGTTIIHIVASLIIVVGAHLRHNKVRGLCYNHTFDLDTYMFSALFFLISRINTDSLLTDNLNSTDCCFLNMFDDKSLLLIYFKKFNFPNRPTTPNHKNN